MARTLDLPILSYQDKTIRIMRFMPPNILSLNPTEDVAQLMFLAADVLSLSSVPCKNHCRIHARYSKEGLASKIIFKDLSNGIGEKSLWFYSIKGLFKVAFEYLDSDFQKFSLTELQKNWLDTMEFPLLQEEMIHHGDLFAQAALRGSALVDGGGSVLGDDGVQHPWVSLPLNQAEGTMHSKQYRLVTKGHHTKTNAQSSTLDISNVNPVCAENTTEHIVTLVQKTLEDVEVLIEATQAAEKSPFVEICNSLVSLLKFFKLEFLSDQSAGSSFPIDILEHYTYLCQETDVSKYFEIRNDIPVRKHLLLCLLCEWIGGQFNALSPIIDTNLQNFKRVHMGCIDNLPPARDIIDLVFPKCMSTLLYHWLNKCQPVKEKPSKVDIPLIYDHQYSCDKSPNKRHKPDCDYGNDQADTTPLIQTILEFANHALISGVAHVVYTKIMHSAVS